MVLSVSKRTTIWIATATFAAFLATMLLPARGLALPAYTQATGQPCSTCHVNPAGGGPLTTTGQAFAAIPTHASNPAAAFTQVSAPAPAAPAPAQPAPAQPAPAAPAPAQPAPAAPAPAAPAPAAPAAPPSALPATGEGNSSADPAFLKAVFGLAAVGAGLGLKGLRARSR